MAISILRHPGLGITSPSTTISTPQWREQDGVFATTIISNDLWASVVCIHKFKGRIKKSTKAHRSRKVGICMLGDSAPGGRMTQLRQFTSQATSSKAVNRIQISSLQMRLVFLLLYFISAVQLNVVYGVVSVYGTVFCKSRRYRSPYIINLLL